MRGDEEEASERAEEEPRRIHAHTAGRRDDEQTGETRVAVTCALRTSNEMPSGAYPPSSLRYVRIGCSRARG
jgi:hypothetical protein